MAREQGWPAVLVRIEDSDGGVTGPGTIAGDHVVTAEPAATVGDLLAALGAPVDRGACVDGRWWPTAAPLSATGLAAGSEVRVGGASAPGPVAATELVIRHGPDAGRRLGVPAGGLVVGRTEGDVRIADPTMSARHARLHVSPTGALQAEDLGSTNGTAGHGDVVRLGATVLEAATTTRPKAPPRPRGLHHRPPRAITGASAVALDPPVAPREPERPRLGVATMAVPLVTGVVLAGLYGPQMAIVAVIGPVIALGGWVAARASNSRAARRLHREHARALAAFRQAAVAALGAEVERRRHAHPDLVAVVDRAVAHDPRVWERRPDHADFLHLAIGCGDVPWQPPTTTGPDAAASAVLADLSVLRDVPIVVDGNSLVGICGPRSFAVPLARSLAAQMVTHHGPSDVRMAVLTSAVAAEDWTWTRWLPHLADPFDPQAPRLACDESRAADLALSISDERDDPDLQRPWMVVDGDDAALQRHAAIRSLLSRSVASDGASQPRGVVIAERVTSLPAACTTVVEVDACGRARVRAIDAAFDQHARVAGLGRDTAERVGRALAPLEDPDCRERHRALPDRCDLLALLDAGAGDAPISEHGVCARWARTAGTDELVAPVGVDAQGAFDVDLVRHGPHVLVAGTTGAGKSELLRSFVASLAATADTDHCNFVLIDFKGGAAFDRLVTLPHVVGLVTDLDEHLAARALRCLEAELRRRERVLRAAGASDVTAYVRARRNDAPREPLPRLVVVVDEFATLVAELPDFVDALVDMAQRGRSLGVHLVLATQRPAGAVKDSIRTNTNLRIALRVVDAGDSRDVVGCDDAARLPVQRPGRAILRCGSADAVTFQTAVVSDRTNRSTAALVEATRWYPARAVVSPPRECTTVEHTPSDLALLVDAVCAAHAASGLPSPQRPWPDPLPDRVALATLDGLASAFALADAPERQRVEPIAWEPDANLIVAGLPGSGVTTTLRTLALAAGSARPAEALHVYATTTDVGALRCLEGLPHCGAVVATDDLERVVRLLRHLEDELLRRRHAGDARHAILLTLIDGVGALRSELEAAGLLDELELLERLAVDGPGAGLVFVFGAEHPSAIGHRLERTAAQRLLLRLPDRADYLHLGLHGLDPTTLPPGRGYLADGSEVQVAHGTAHDAAALAARPSPAAIGRARPRSIERLPDVVRPGDIGACASLDGDALRIELAMGGHRLEPRALSILPGDHVLVAGPSRSGKTTALDELATLVRRDTPVDVVALGTGRRSLDRPTIPQLHEMVARLLASDARTIVLVDDADLFDDGGALLPLVQPGRPGLHVVAAGRADRLRGLFRHWTNEVRRSRLGVLLRGDELDGDLFGVRVPRRSTAPWRPGRGWLVGDDTVELCQFVCGASTAEAATITGRTR